jgi:general secretion pathway protein A
MLMERAAIGRTTVLIVDEAHNLDWDVLEEVRLLGNLENRRGKLLQIILAGQPELDEKLERPEYRQLKQRISLRCALRGFDLSEATSYIHSRMAKAGVPTQTIMPRNIIEELHFRTQGIPRLINAVCDNLLLTCFAMETRTATMEILDEVTSDMRLDYPDERPVRMGATPFPERIVRRS